jgi:hypothetical protein
MRPSAASIRGQAGEARRRHPPAGRLDVSKAILGILAAISLTLIAADASIFGVAAWKVVLAAIGLALFVRNGPPRRPPPG